MYEEKNLVFEYIYIILCFYFNYKVVGKKINCLKHS